jgi:RNA polymerase sigma factor (sigma-70 family)
MFEKFTVNAGRNLVKDEVSFEDMGQDCLSDLINILHKSQRQYCVIINVVENSEFSEQRRCLSRLKELVTSLTPRETEVLRLAIDGLSNNEISEKLCISCETVKSHRKKLLSKVGVSNVNDLKHMLFKTTSVREIIF